jgi:hypothetical protein
MKQVLIRILATTIFAIAMAWMESAVVVYLREIYGIHDIIRDLVLEVDPYTKVEIGRELATLIMLAALGFLTGKNNQERMGYACIAFGIWDIFYYVWLHVFIDWPASLLEWDILFLVPLPWWGPVLSPVLIAALMIAGGILAVVRSGQNRKIRLRLVDWSILIVAISLALYAFMSDAIAALFDEAKKVVAVRPTVFPWIPFLFSLAGMTYFIFRLGNNKTPGNRQASKESV